LKDEALEKYNIISPYLKRESNLSNIASKTNINLRTLQRWVQIYGIQGLIGLSRKKRRDIGCCRKIKNEMKNAIEGLALKKENISIATITRIVNEYCIEQKLDKVSYYTIRKVIKKIPDDLKVLAKNGDKVYGNKYEMIIRRTSKYPNQMWQTDHSLLDLLIVDCDNQKKKPWLTVVIDDFSRAIAGFSLFTGDPSSLQTGLALRQAIWYKQDKVWVISGIPETLYTDHGSDFTSNHIKQVCLDLKINLIHSIVGKPRGRGKVERFFLSLEQKLLSLLRIKKKIYELSELEGLIKEFVINDYNYSIHTTTKERPIDLWNKGKIIPNMPESIAQLNSLLLTPKKSRIVQRDGIRFSGLRYYHPNLCAYVGEIVTIKYDPADLGEIWVYEADKLICKAVCEELQNSAATYEDLKKVRTQRKKELKKAIKSKL
jgi:putative transposase